MCARRLAALGVLIVALVAGFVTRIVAAESVLTISEFRDLFAKAVKERYPTSVITPSGDTVLEIATPEGARGRVDVKLPYQDYLKDPSARAQLLDRYTGMMAIALSSTPLVSVKTLAIQVLPPNMGGFDDAAGPVVRPLAGDVTSRLVFELSKNVKYASIDDLKTLNLTPEQAWVVAAENDRRRPALKAGQLATASRADAVMGDNAAGRLIADPATCGRGGEGKGDPRIFLILASGAYAVGDPRRANSMKRFWDQVREVEAKAIAESRLPITCANGKWVVPPPP